MLDNDDIMNANASEAVKRITTDSHSTWQQKIMFSATIQCSQIYHRRNFKFF